MAPLANNSRGKSIKTPGARVSPGKLLEQSRFSRAKQCCLIATKTSPGSSRDKKLRRQSYRSVPEFVLAKRSLEIQFATETLQSIRTRNFDFNRDRNTAEFCRAPQRLGGQSRPNFAFNSSEQFAINNELPQPPRFRGRVCGLSHYHREVA